MGEVPKKRASRKERNDARLAARRKQKKLIALKAARKGRRMERPK